MLLESRIYSFIDQKNSFTLHFLEGQKLIHDIFLTHHEETHFNLFRNIILSTQLLLAYLKPNESLGLYIDSDIPFFRYKIEMSDQGKMRTLLIKDDSRPFPPEADLKIAGKCRFLKTSPGDKTPYASIIPLNNVDSLEIINLCLLQSYQIKGKVFISETTDQSFMISKLPAINVNKSSSEPQKTIDEIWHQHTAEIKNFLHENAIRQVSYSEIQKFFEGLGLEFLSSKEVLLKCNCSRERMFNGIMSLVQSSGIDSIFESQLTPIETKCDYCHTVYSFSRGEFLI